MSVKVVKGVRQIGTANASGVSFPIENMLVQAKNAYEAVQKEVDERGGVTTGPARVLIVIEQDALMEDDNG